VSVGMEVGENSFSRKLEGSSKICKYNKGNTCILYINYIK